MIMRSCGTSTRSNIRMASPSSKRLLSGRSNALCAAMEAFAAEDREAGRIHRHHEGQHELVLARLARIVGADVALVGDRRQGREHAAAADDDALGRALDHLHRLRRRIERRAVGLRIDQRVGDLRSRSRGRCSTMPWARAAASVLPSACSATAWSTRKADMKSVSRPIRPKVRLARRWKQPASACELLARARFEIGRAHRLARRRRRVGQEVAQGRIVLVVVQGRRWCR